MATYKPTQAFWKIHKLIKEGLLKYKEIEEKTGVKQKVVFIIQGGAGAGKTIATMMLLIDSFSTKKHTHRITVASDELTKMRDTVVMDFQNIGYDWGIYNPNKWNDQKARYLFSPSKFIEFKGLDKDGVGKGRRREIVFINEGNKITSQKFEDITLRAQLTIVDYNPDTSFWANELINPFNFITLTFEDNEYLSQQERANILDYKTRGYNEQGEEINAYWANKWRVYGLGLEGRIDGVIYQNWELGEFDETLPKIYGMDFGFKDPFTLIENAYNKKEGKLYLREKIYKTGLNINQIIELLTVKIDKNSLIIADCADHNAIATIANAGFNIIGLGKEKIINGIRAIQNWQMVISPESANMINELHNYIWLDRAGEVPIDAHNHTLDPLRYVNKYWRYQNL